MKNKPRSPFSDNTDFVPKPKNPALPQPNSKIGQQSAAQLTLFQEEPSPLASSLQVFLREFKEQQEVKPGYKLTEVGIIPEDWQVVTASEACTVVVDCKNRTPPFIPDSEFAVVRTPNVREGHFIKEDLRYTDETSFREWTSRAIPQIGDIMITREAPLGEVCPVPPDLKICLGQRMMLYRPNPFKTDNQFLLYALLSSQVRANLILKMGGSTVGHAKVDDIRFLQIPFPQLNEQLAIAEALSDVDALLDPLDRLIAKKRDIKQATMQQLLTGKTRLPGFDGEWVETRVGNFSPLQRGFDLPTHELRKGCYPVVYSNGIQNYHSHFMVKGPGVVTGRSGTIGKVHFIDEDYWPHNTALWVTNYKGNNPKFVFYILSQINLEQLGTGSGVPTLNRNDVHGFYLRVPPLSEEQAAIASVLSDMDAELEALEQRREKTRAIKQGMMQELLTGRTRLV